MRSVKLSARDARYILAVLRSEGLDRGPAAETLRAALKPKPISSARRKTKARRESKREETARIRRAVFARDDYRCVHCGCIDCEAAPLQLDHFFGRGKEPQTVRNCWTLCAVHHRHKTDGVPTASFWLEAFAIHAECHGYRAEAAKARSRLEALTLVEAAKEQIK